MAEQKETIGINRGKLDSLNIYEVSERELQTIETGSNDSIFLNFGIFFLSVAISFFIVLFTVDFFYDDRDDLLIKFIVFLCVAILTLIGSIICFVAWWRNKDDFKTTIAEIKKRIKQEVIETSDDESIDVTE
jgi:hypothetical protein